MSHKTLNAFTLLQNILLHRHLSTMMTRNGWAYRTVSFLFSFNLTVFFFKAPSTKYPWHTCKSPHTVTETTKGNIYLKHRESNVEVLDEAPVTLVRLLHERHEHVVFTLVRSTFTEQFVNPDPILWISPEALWKSKKETNVHFTISARDGWIRRMRKTIWQPVHQLLANSALFVMEHVVCTEVIIHILKNI